MDVRADGALPLGTEQNVKNKYCIIVVTLVSLAASTLQASAQDEGELAKKLQNPVANLISVPIQNNWDFGIGPADAMPLHRQRSTGHPILAHGKLEPHHSHNHADHPRRIACERRTG